MVRAGYISQGQILIPKSFLPVSFSSSSGMGTGLKLMLQKKGNNPPPTLFCQRPDLGPYWFLARTPFWSTKMGQISNREEQRFRPGFPNERTFFLIQESNLDFGNRTFLARCSRTPLAVTKPAFPGLEQEPHGCRAISACKPGLSFHAARRQPARRGFAGHAPIGDTLYFLAYNGTCGG
jgi:hypothetical protein